MVMELLEIIKSVVQALNGYVLDMFGGNQIIAGAVTVSLITAILFLSRKIVRFIYYTAKKKLTHTLIFTYSRDVSRPITKGSDGVDRLSLELEKAIFDENKNNASKSSLIIINNVLSRTIFNGVFFTKLGGCYCLIKRTEDTEKRNGGDNTLNLKAYNLEIITLRKSVDTIVEFLRALVPPKIVKDIRTLECGYGYNGGSSFVRHVKKQPNLVFNREEFESIDKTLTNFKKRWDVDKDARLVFLLEGEPGTGKSTLAEVIANKLETSLFTISSGPVEIKQELDSYKRVASHYLTEGQIPVILADEFDQLFKLTTDQLDGGKKPKFNELLTSLQSPSAVSGCIIIFTTNNLDKIPPSIYRRGRVDLVLEIKRLRQETINEYCLKVYGKPLPEDMVLEPKRACDITGWAEDANGDFETFLKLLSENKTDSFKITKDDHHDN